PAADRDPNALSVRSIAARPHETPSSPRPVCQTKRTKYPNIWDLVAAAVVVRRSRDAGGHAGSGPSRFRSRAGVGQGIFLGDAEDGEKSLKDVEGDPGRRVTIWSRRGRTCGRCAAGTPPSRRRPLRRADAAVAGW